MTTTYIPNTSQIEVNVSSIATVEISPLSVAATTVTAAQRGPKGDPGEVLELDGGSASTVYNMDTNIDGGGA